MDHNRPLERCFVIIGVVYTKSLVFKCHLLVMCLYRYQIGQTNTTTNTRNRKIVLDYEVDNFCMIFVLFLSWFSLYTVVSCKIIMVAVIPDFFIQRYLQMKSTKAPSSRYNFCYMHLLFLNFEVIHCQDIVIQNTKYKRALPSYLKTLTVWHSSFHNNLSFIMRIFIQVRSPVSRCFYIKRNDSVSEILKTHLWHCLSTRTIYDI